METYLIIFILFIFIYWFFAESSPYISVWRKIKGLKEKLIMKVIKRKEHILWPELPNVSIG